MQYYVEAVCNRSSDQDTNAVDGPLSFLTSREMGWIYQAKLCASPDRLAGVGSIFALFGATIINFPVHSTSNE
jgi:hypothetical protein